MQQGNIPQNGTYVPPIDLSQTETVAPQEKRKFKNKETIFAWLSLVFGYLFCRAVPAHQNPLGCLLCFVLLFAVTFGFVYKKEKRFPRMAWFSAISAIVVLGVLFFTANTMLQSLAFCYAVVAYCHFVMVALEGGIAAQYPEFLAADFLKALVVMPFASFGLLFPALGETKEKKWGGAALKVLYGLAAALIPTGVIVALLSYDADFTALLGQIFDFDIKNVISHLFSAACGVPVGMYLFGLYYSSGNGKCRSVITASACTKAVSNLRFAPALVLFSAALPILAVYIIFFLSQWRYYISGFLGILPENFSYALYAREGFFQLLAVSIINLVLITGITLFWKRNGNQTPLLLRVLSVAFAVCTLILVGTAMAKLVLYIDAYGLTPKRVYAAWFMVVLVILFVLVCIKQFRRKFRLIPTALICVVTLFALLGISGSDTLIAEYNVEHYLSGDLETVDVEAMEELGDAAIPALVRLTTAMDQGSNSTVAEDVLSADVQGYLASDSDFYSGALVLLGQTARECKNSLFSATLPSIRAKNALRSIDIPLGDAYIEARSEMTQEFAEPVSSETEYLE